MELSDLTQWTPVRLILRPPEAAIEWCDLRGLRFEEPFFDQTVARWTDRPLVRTSLQELALLDAEPSLDPIGFVFHMSRCGSTLVSRLLSTLPGMVVAAEPGPINALLELDPALVDDAARATVLRLLIRALGRIRAGDETRYVVKLSSWNVRLLPLFRQAFPDVPRIWVHRAPAEVMASILAGPPGWMQLHRFPLKAQYLFSLDPAAVETMTPEEFCARALASMIESWLAEAGPDALTVDYRTLPEAVWDRVAPFLKLDLDEAAIARMAEEGRYYAKDPGKRVFAAGPTTTPAIRPELYDLARRLVEPAYRRLIGG
jgi:hypothetical protein